MSTLTVVLGGRMADGTGAPPVEDAAVLVREGKVAAAGPRDAVEIPPEAHVIDASDRTILPGIVEGHAHVGGNPAAQKVLRLSLQRGITTVCSVSANPPGITLRDGIASGDVRGCARLVAGCIVTPTFGHVRYRTADGPWEVRKAVREMVQEGADFIKTAASGGFWAEDEDCSVRNYTLEELVALADEAHAWRRPVAVHAHTQPGINNSIEAGIDMIHHGAFIDEAGVRGIHEKGLYFMPTLRVTCDKNIAAWPDRPWMAEEMTQAQPIHREGVRLAHRLGVKLCAGSDYPGSAHSWRVGDACLWELMELVDCGLTPLEAIVAATRNNAEAFGLLKHVGTLEPGKRADLIVVSGDPLEDIRALYRPENINLVMKDGNVESTDEAHAAHYTVREALPPPRSGEDPGP